MLNEQIKKECPYSLDTGKTNNTQTLIDASKVTAANLFGLNQEYYEDKLMYRINPSFVDADLENLPHYFKAVTGLEAPNGNER
ncbi:MAG: hypothetical protein WC156_00040 [Pedobacter sp.]